MSDLPHLMSRIVGTPLLMAPGTLEPLLSVVHQKLSGIKFDSVDEDDEPQSHDVNTLNGIAVIPVMGTLVRRSSYLTTACGMTSYQTLLNQAEQAFNDPSIHAVLLEIDSGGGEAGGVFDTANRLRQLAHDSQKPLWAIANEGAMSAAYAIACAADQVFVTTTAEVGSIGVVACHLDQSKSDSMDGLRYTYLFAGDRKVDGNPHHPLTDDARVSIQRDIDQLYGQFVQLVASMRGMEDKLLIDTQAQVYRGADAVAAGLADKVAPLSEVLSLLQQQITPSNAPSQAALLSFITMEKPAMENAEQQAAVLSATSVDEALIKAKLEQQLRREMAQLNDIAAQAKRLGITVDPAQALADGVSPDALRAQVLTAASERDAADISAAHSVTNEPQAKTNRLLDAVKKVAGV